MRLIERRQFLSTLLVVPAVGSLFVAKRARAADGSLQSFAYYEGLGETDTHSAYRTDGTTYNMPCITSEEITAATDADYTFWHGHDGMDHTFTVTAADFQKLQSGKDVMIYTSVVEGHRHALLISPSSPCENETCAPPEGAR